ncbi:MAG: hypothetical protein WAT39_13545 [Planctomycetota bacterium]
MHLESHATPSRVSPQQRYANLHRAIERGLDSDEIWKELAAVSLHLGHEDEARRCVPRIRSAAARSALESRLERLGVLAAPDGNHAAAPAASDAGPDATAPAEAAGLRDHFADACQYLLHQRMPWLALLTTLAFPLVIGLGGFLTAGGSMLLLAAIAAVPGLCVLGLVGAMARQVLLASARGDSDVPAIPSFWTLVGDARRFFVDLGLVLGVLVGPAVAAAGLGAPWTAVVPAAAIGAFFVPMAWTLRQVHGDLTALSPVRLVRAIARAGGSYAGVATVVLLLFVPATLTAMVTLGRPVWVQIAIVGPLSVLPLFVSARLLGTWLEPRRHFVGATQTPAANAGRTQPRPVVTGVAAAARPHAPKRPEALEHFRAPAAARSAKAQPVRATARATPRPVAARPVAPRPAAAAPAGHRTPRAIEGRAPARPCDGPDLAHMPGATLVTGEDRRRQGAAARQP